MSYVSPKMRPQFESLSIELKNEILKQNVEIHTLQDLIKSLETVIAQA